MWDERFRAEEYAYGKEPNDFLRERYGEISRGRVLSLAEGEGRNAVFLAQQGYAVTAVDSSPNGINKAKQLADQYQAEVEWILADLTEFDLGVEQWDGIISIFCPLPSVVRKDLHRRVVAALKPQGVFLMEGYTPAQLKYGTGGGDDPDRMVSQEQLRQELQGLTFGHLVECERTVVEGVYHTGLAAVVQVIASKPESAS